MSDLPGIPAGADAARRRRFGLPVLCGLLLAAGCATQPSRPAIIYSGDPLKDGLQWIEKGPPKDKVLWQYRTALVAMRRGEFDLARTLLDEAILSLGAMMQPDRATRQSRSYFQEEAKKTFYGEPYERVMAWYYRGILYWMEGELDNARACFRSAQFQDSDADEASFKSDFVVLDYLEGVLNEKLGQDGSDSFQRARELSKLARLPEYSDRANVILFVDFGSAPQKYAGGEYGEELRFRTGVSPVRSARLSFGGRTLLVVPTDDLYFQATTRGGRVMDHVLANKAVFKKTTDTVGSAAVISGAILATQEDTQEAGLIVLGAGILSKIFSAATRAEADTRTWQNLPWYLSFALLELPPGGHSLTVEFLDAAGNPVPRHTRVLAIEVVPDRDNVFYVSDQSVVQQSTSTNEDPS